MSPLPEKVIVYKCVIIIGIPLFSILSNPPLAGINCVIQTIVHINM